MKVLQMMNRTCWTNPKEKKPLLTARPKFYSSEPSSEPSVPGVKEGSDGGSSETFKFLFYFHSMSVRTTWEY